METHPGLEFLRDAPDFHSRYIHTVSMFRLASNISLYAYGKKKFNIKALLEATKLAKAKINFNPSSFE